MTEPAGWVWFLAGIAVGLAPRLAARFLGRLPISLRREEPRDGSDD